MTLDFNEDESESKKEQPIEPDKRLARYSSSRYDAKAITPISGVTRQPPLAERFQNYYIQPDPLSLRLMFRESWEAGLFRLQNGRTSPITPTFFAAALDAAGESAWEGFIDEILAYEIKPLSWWDKNILKRPNPQERLKGLSIIAYLSQNPNQRPLIYLLSRTLAQGQTISGQLAEANQELTFYRLRDTVYNPLQLDQMWAVFYATGSAEMIRRIIGVAAGKNLASTDEIQAKTRYSTDIIMQGAAYSLMRMAEKQEKVAYQIYKALPEYEDQPIYLLLLVALQAAHVIESFEPTSSDSFDIKWRIPPDWL